MPDPGMSPKITRSLSCLQRLTPGHHDPGDGVNIDGSLRAQWLVYHGASGRKRSLYLRESEYPFTIKSQVYDSILAEIGFANSLGIRE